MRRNDVAYLRDDEVGHGHTEGAADSSGQAVKGQAYTTPTGFRQGPCGREDVSEGREKANA